MVEEQTPESVAARLREQFAPAYLTLTSIIQGVALSALVIRVEGNLDHFGLEDWLLATAVGFTFGLVAYATQRTQTYRHRQDNAGVVGAISGYAGLRLAFTAVPVALFLGAWALYDVLGFGRAPVVVAAVSVLIVLAAIAGTIPYWNRVLAYAHGEHQHAAERKPPASSQRRSEAQ